MDRDKNDVYGETEELTTLIDNDTITEADQRTPRLALKAIQTAIKRGNTTGTTGTKYSATYDSSQKNRYIHSATE